MARLTPLHLYRESKNVKSDGDLKVHHLPSMWRIDSKVFSALKEHVFPFWTNSSKTAPCSLSIYSALSDLQLLVTEEQIPRGITFWLKVNTCATSSLLELSFLSFSELHSSLPISLPEKGGMYDGTVSSSWGIPRLVSIGNGREQKRKDFILYSLLFLTLFYVSGNFKRRVAGPG